MDANRVSAAPTFIRSTLPAIKNFLVCSLITVSLFACGDSSAPDTSTAVPDTSTAAALPTDSELNVPDEFYLFDEYAIKAATNYKGRTDELGFQSNESVAVAISNAMFGAIENKRSAKQDSDFYYHWLGIPYATLTTDLPLIDINASRRSFPGSRVHTCDADGANAGTADVSRESKTLETGEDAFWFTFDYDNCKEPGNRISYTGSVQLLFVRERSEEINSVLLAYDDVTLLKGGRRYLVTGAIKVYDPIACGFEGERIHYLNIQDIETGESVFLENFITGRHDRADHNCDGYASDSNYFRGRVYNSEYGLFHVSTAAPLGDNVTSYPKLQPYYPGSTDSTNLLGELTIRSQSDEISIGLSNSRYAPEDLSSVIPKDAAIITVSRESHAQTAQFLHNIALFKSGSFLDLSDDDGDGMNNSWEDLVGLSKSDSNDAVLDADGDLRPSILEFTTGGNPSTATIKGSAVDRRLEVEVSHVKFRNGVINVELSLYSDNDDPNLSSSNIVFRADAEGNWQFNDNQCEVNEKKELVCVARVKSFNVQFRPTSDGVVVIETMVSESDHDINNDNNSITHEVDFAATQYDFEINANAQSFIPASESGAHSITAQIRNTFGGPGHGMVVEIPIPDGVNMTRVTSKEGSVRIPSCKINESVVCQFRELYLREPIEIELFFEFTGTDPVTFEWNVARHPFEKMTDNNTTTTTFIRTQSTTELERLIHNAIDGDSIELPPGHYDGKLFLGLKNLIISGSTGIEPTWLYTFRDTSYSFANPGSNSIIRNIRFVGPGTPILFNAGDHLTIENNQFISSYQPGEQTKMLVAPTFPGNSTHPERDAAYRFINNRVVGYGRIDNSPCTQLLTATGWRATIIQGNWFDSVYCENGLIGNNRDLANQQNDSALLSFDQNTITKSGVVLGFELAAGEVTPFRLGFSNNIFHNIDQFASDVTLSQLNLVPGALSSSNNIVHLDKSDKVLGLLEEDPTSLWIDPLFSNASTGEYFLQAQSAAVDAWQAPKNYSEIQSEINGFQFQPDSNIYDGNSDGIAYPDIGAFELIP